MKDYYAILQVSPSAEQEVIEAAYRRLARKYHPDVYSGPDAAHRMRELNEAYEILGDPRRRAEYDAELRFARAGAETKRPQGDRTPPPPPPPHDEPKDSEGPTGAKAETPTARLTRRRPILIGVGLATMAILGSLAALGVWGWISATGDSDNTSPTVVTGSSLSTAVSQWLGLGVATPEPTRFPTSVVTTPIATPAAIATPPVNWEIYRNEGYGFEVRYPPDFNVIESESGQSVTFESKKWAGYPANHSSIGVGVEETNLSALEWLDQNEIFGPLYRDEHGQMYIYAGRAGTLTKESVVTLRIDGAEAIEFFWWGVSAGGDHVLVKDKNKPNSLYHIERYLAGALQNPEETVPKEVFDQMLSTFKFLD